MKNFLTKKVVDSRFFSILFIGLFLAAKPVLAAEIWENAGAFALGTVSAAIAVVLGWISYVFTAVLGLIITLLVKLLVGVAQYSNIINVPTVANGWVIVRDICNMFFVLIFLVIAFATILRQEQYSAKRLVPKLLIMAVLINFSKTIFGLIIDFAQVIMLTFVSAFSQGGGWFIQAFQVDKFLKLDTEGNLTQKAFGQLGVVAAIIGSVIASIITLIVVAVLLGVLVVRIVMLWLYTILSPLVFLGFAFPPLQKYTGRIWEDFIKQVITGPLLAFFLWLALTTAQNSAGILNNQTMIAGTGEVCAGASSFFCEGDFQKYIIVIGLLMGGLMITQQLGGAAGSIAGKGVAWARRTGTITAGIGAAGLLKAGRGADAWQVSAQKKIAAKLGVEGYTPKSLNYRLIGQAWKANRESNLRKYESGTGGVGAWRDTFNKYLHVGQYAAVRVSRKEQISRIRDADKLGQENKMISMRIENSKIPLDQRSGKIKALENKKDQLVVDYNNKGFDGEAEYKRDWDALDASKPFDTDAAQAQIEGNNRKAEELRDFRARIGGVPIGFKGAGSQYGQNLTEYYKSSFKENQKKEMSEMSTRTNDEEHAVISEMLQGYANNDIDKVVSAFKILAKNNDLNEALKDPRVMNLMTKQSGILENIARNMNLNVNQTRQMIQNYRTAPVTPAYAQAMIQGMFKSMKVEDSVAAQHANEIGSLSFGAGNSLAYAMSSGDAASGNYKYNQLRYDEGEGGLVSSEARINAIIGKFANLESQQLTRVVHPDVTIKEAPDGSAAGMSYEGREFWRRGGFSAHHVGQISRFRGDNINKIGGSEDTLRDIKKLADQLAASGNEAQANVLKIIAGYLKSKKDGTDVGEKNDKYIEAIDSLT